VGPSGAGLTPRGYQRAIALRVVRILDQMQVDLLNEGTAAEVNVITAAVIYRGEPLHALCRAAAERLPTRQQLPRRIRSPALQPRAQGTSPTRYRKPGRLTSSSTPH
jgi:hypothetical protein